MKPQNLIDIKKVILETRITKPGTEARTEFFYVRKLRSTFAITIEIPSTGYIDTENIRTHVGIARKRKGDKYDQDTGEIIALLNSKTL